MKHAALIIAATLAFASAAVTNALTVAQAKALGDNAANVTIGPVTISTTNDLNGSGYTFPAQDASGGVLLYGPGTTLSSLISAHGLTPGSIVTFNGTGTWYYGMYELGYVTVVTNEGAGAVPAPIDIDAQDLQNGAPTGKICQSMLVRITGVVFRDQGQSFVSPGTYSIYKYGLTNTVRLQDAADPLNGTTIPVGTCTIQGVLAQNSASNPGENATDRYQIYPLKITPDVSQDDPNIAVSTNFNFGSVYPTYSRTLAYRIANGGVASGLVVTAIAPLSGATANFTMSVTFPFTVAPGDATNIAVTYAPGASPNQSHAAVFQIASNDPSNPNTDVAFFGNSPANALANVWINEVNYDSPGDPDSEEFIEICGAAATDITGWKIELWNGSPFGLSNYYTHVIGSVANTNFTLQNEADGFGFYTVRTSNSTVPADEDMLWSRIENGAPDAIRLTDGAENMKHFLEYESSSASVYPGIGTPDDLCTIDDIGGLSNLSISSVGTGPSRLDFTWALTNNTPHGVNLGQAVPEPFSIGLGALALCAAFVARRR